ncbi:SCO4225 family membrane protein [Actinomadura sp. J1-007]
MVAAVLMFAEDPGFIGIWLVFATLPLSAVALALTEMAGELPRPFDMAVFFVATTGVGLVQAWVLRLLVRGRRVPVSR